MILDAGFLIGIERGERRVIELSRHHLHTGRPTVTSAGVVAQVWRDGARQSRLVVWLRGVEVVSIDTTGARLVGELLAAHGAADVVDGHLALLVRRLSFPVATSDRDDLERLGVPADIILDV